MALFPGRRHPGRGNGWYGSSLGVGPGSADEAPEPPPITLAEICAVPTVMPSATPVLATLPPATALAQAQGTATAALLFTPTPIPPPTTATSATPGPTWVLWPFLLGLAGCCFYPPAGFVKRL
ncbi:MAG: hypothetical protein IPL78_23420 [Chloroflexi bacterium]|nr:hypothetical protein [Chloroflexota bacterium]